MIWQDVLIMIGGFGFAIALIPAVWGRAKPPKSTCLLTATILTSYIIAFATLGLWLAAISTSLTAMMWWILLIQKREPQKWGYLGSVTGKEVKEMLKKIKDE